MHLELVVDNKMVTCFEENNKDNHSQNLAQRVEYSRSIMSQILNTLEYCRAHYQGMAHLQLLPRKVLLKKLSYPPVVCLLDMGVHEIFDYQRCDYDVVMCSAPEVLQACLSRHGQAELELDKVQVDLFSVGVLLFWLLSRKRKDGNSSSSSYPFLADRRDGVC